MFIAQNHSHIPLSGLCSETFWFKEWKTAYITKKNLLTGKRGVGESSRRATEDSTWLKLEKDHLF